MTTWTTPRTWITGEVLSSTNFNTHIRDNLAFYGGTDSLNTTPPATPGNGQRWVLPVDTAAGVFWEFMYYTALAAWVFQGGARLHKDVTLSQTPGTSFVALTTPATFTLARAGVYRIFENGLLEGSAGFIGNLTTKIGAAAAADADGINPQLDANRVTQGRMIEKTAAASDVVQLMLRTTGAGVAITGFASLTIEPLRVT